MNKRFMNENEGNVENDELKTAQQILDALEELLNSESGRQLLLAEIRVRQLRDVYAMVHRLLNNEALVSYLPYDQRYRLIIDMTANSFNLSDKELADLGRYLSKRQSSNEKQSSQ